MATVATTPEPNGRIGELLQRISDDVRTLARDEIELAKGEIEETAKRSAGEAAAVVLGGFVALVGICMLCVVVVVALDVIIASLAIRLLLMAIVYCAVGGAVAAAFAHRLRAGIKPNLSLLSYEAKRTVAGVKDTLAHS